MAYLNLWVAVTFLPGAAATFFKHGPFAWNRLFDFWLPLTTFSLWIIVMGVLTAKAAAASGARRGCASCKPVLPDTKGMDEMRKDQMNLQKETPSQKIDSGFLRTCE